MAESHELVTTLRGTILRFLILALFIWWFGVADATKKHQNHQQFHRDVNSASLNSAGIRNTSTSAELLVAQALAAMEFANKLRMENIHFNKNEFREWSTRSNVSLAPPLLGYLNQTIGNENSTNVSLKTARSLNSSGSTNSSGSDGMYSIPEELAKALKAAAEAEPQPRSTNEGSPGTIELLATFRHETKDTNAMPQKLVNPDGLFEYVAPIVPNPSLENNNVTTASAMTKRAAVGFWMETIQKKKRN